MIIALDNIRSQYNVGSIFRTVDGAFGNECKLLLGGYTPTPEKKDVSKTALGAEKNIPWESVSNLFEVLKDLKSRNYELISIEENSKSRNFFEHIEDFKPLGSNKIIVFGTETTGISKEILDISDHILHLPMNGIKNSLNVASTVSAVCYTIVLTNK